MIEPLISFIRLKNGEEKKFEFPAIESFTEQKIFAPKFTDLTSPQEWKDGIISCGSVGTLIGRDGIFHYSRQMGLRGDTTENQTCIDVDLFVRDEQTGKITQRFENKCSFHHISIDKNNIEGFYIGFKLGDKEYSQEINVEKIKELLKLKLL